MAVGGPRRRWRVRPEATGEYAYARGTGASYLGAIDRARRGMAWVYGAPRVGRRLACWSSTVPRPAGQTIVGSQKAERSTTGRERVKTERVKTGLLKMRLYMKPFADVFSLKCA